MMAPPWIRFTFPCFSNSFKSLRMVASEISSSLAMSFTFKILSCSKRFNKYKILSFPNIKLPHIVSFIVS